MTVMHVSENVIRYITDSTVLNLFLAVYLLLNLLHNLSKSFYTSHIPCQMEKFTHFYLIPSFTSQLLHYYNVKHSSTV